MVSCNNRDSLSANMELDPRLERAPQQFPVSTPSFNKEIGNEVYEIKPVHSYEIYGLVVSYELHNARFGLHRLSGDHLNIADYCVVWGKNALQSDLSKFEFWNGQFTCFYQTGDSSAWQSWNNNEISNNHLITSDPYLRSQLRKISIGDQIRLTGHLANYRNVKSKGWRNSSVTRDDTGNGACETFYVDYVQILKTYHSPWRWLMYISTVTLISAIIALFVAPYRRIR